MDDGMAVARDARDEGAKDARHAVERNTDSLVGELERLGGLIARLDERLAPVLAETPDERVLADVNARLVPAPESPHAATLREITMTISGHRERLDRMLTRLDLS